MSQDINWIQEIIRLVATLFAAGIGAWLSIRYLPLKAKRDAWLWQRKLEAQELIFNTLSTIAFDAHNYLKGEYADAYSMSGKNHLNTQESVFDGVKLLHERSAGLRLLLSTAQNKYLDEFLIKSQEVLDDAIESWGQWNQDDKRTEMEYTNNILSRIGDIAEDTLKKLKGTIAPVYK